MAITNHDRVGKAMELLKGGLGPFVEREFKSTYKDRAAAEASAVPGRRPPERQEGRSQTMDVAALLKLMWESWNDVFRLTLGPAERSLVSELRDHRNKWAHQEAFSGDDAYRALDSAGRLLTAVSAPQADEIEKMKTELLRLRFDEQVRSEKRKSAGTAIEAAAAGGLKPWREVVTPHKDVASGRYQQAEFAADLWQVHLGEGTDEYRNPVEFFRRTYLTESLKRMLVGAVRRLAGQGGDPVVQLQTNFGGGKTHSMLALYHLFSGIAPTELLGIDAVMAEAEREDAADGPARRAGGQQDLARQPGHQARRHRGAHALGRARLAARRQEGVRPHPGRRREGDQPRRRAARAVQRVRAVPDPDRRVGGLRAPAPRPERPARRRLRDAVHLRPGADRVGEAGEELPARDQPAGLGHRGLAAHPGGRRRRWAASAGARRSTGCATSWAGSSPRGGPASAEEGFEIVRRRLFEPMADRAQFTDRDVVARAFADLYRTQHQEFPPECRDADYEKRIKAAYPIHPEIFDRLYTDWSTLVKFQRTRGVLRLMAAVIHSLWEKGDKTPLILPANISIDDPRVQFELTRYLSDNWVPVIEKDVDGPNSLPLRMDGEVPNLGKFSACRRVARTIYLGSAPTTTAAHRGIEDRRVKLGCVMPGESPAIFGDALRRLAGAATYLYQDGPRYWYSTQPTVTKLAEDRAEQLKRDPDKVVHELDRRLRADLRKTGDFSRIHPMPQSGQDVPDDLDARLVVLRIDHPYSKEPGSAAEVAAKAIFESRGNTPRLYRNTLVFLAADKTRLQDLDEAARKYLAWESILAEKEIGAEPHAAAGEAGRNPAAPPRTAPSRRAFRRSTSGCWFPCRNRRRQADRVAGVPARLGAATRWPCARARSCRNDELLVTGFAGTLLRMELDRVPLWRGNHVAVKQLAEDFARYLYLPRLKDSVGAGRRHPRRRGAVDLAGGELRLRRQLRRDHGPLPGIARWTACPAGRMPTRPACS